MRRQALAALALPLLAASGAAIADPATSSVLPPYLQADTPVGTWDVTIQTYNCSTGAANPTFHSLLSFGPGGTEAETTNNPALAVGQRSPAFGSWGYTGFRHIALTTKAFILFSSPQGPIKQGTQVIRHAITLTGSTTFTDAAVLTFYDQTGAATLTSCANATGTRL